MCPVLNQFICFKTGHIFVPAGFYAHLFNYPNILYRAKILAGAFADDFTAIEFMFSAI